MQYAGAGNLVNWKTTTYANLQKIYIQSRLAFGTQHFMVETSEELLANYSIRSISTFLECIADRILVTLFT
jgi:hypothetical protein